jgi:hypothetical protein
VLTAIVAEITVPNAVPAIAASSPLARSPGASLSCDQHGKSEPVVPP